MRFRSAQVIAVTHRKHLSVLQNFAMPRCAIEPSPFVAILRQMDLSQKTESPTCANARVMIDSMFAQTAALVQLRQHLVRLNRRVY